MSGIVGANFLKESGLKRSHKFQRFTATGASTWVKPSGITMVRIECVGAGGGGAGGWHPTSGDGQCTAAGGGAAIVMGTYNAASLPTTLTVTVGAGGTAGAGSTNSNGTSGGYGGNTDVSGTNFILKAWGGVVEVGEVLEVKEEQEPPLLVVLVAIQLL